MLPIKDEGIIANSRIDSSINIWLYLSIEFLIGAIISGFLSTLNAIKSLLPKPPRSLAGDVVLVRILFIYIIHLESHLMFQIFPVNSKYHICTTQNVVHAIRITQNQKKLLVLHFYKNEYFF